MTIIRNESTPQKLRLLIDNPHIVVTTWFQGWSGLKNEALLVAAEEAGFDRFITADQEQLVLRTNNWGVVKLTAAIPAATSGSFVFVEIRHRRG